MVKQLEVDSDFRDQTLQSNHYFQALNLRKAHDTEDNLTKKYNTRSLQVFKSNWKLNKKESDAFDKIESINKIFAADSASINDCRGTISQVNDSNEQKLEKSKFEIHEQVGKFENKFFNFYKTYDSKNLLIAMDEGRESTEKESNELNALKRRENSCMEKGKDIFSQNIFEYLQNMLVSVDKKTLLEELLIKRGNRDASLKCLQNKITTDEVSAKKSKYNLSAQQPIN